MCFFCLIIHAVEQFDKLSVDYFRRRNSSSPSPLKPASASVEGSGTGTGSTFEKVNVRSL
jgi:hypothetical protein